MQNIYNSMIAQTHDQSMYLATLVAMLPLIVKGDEKMDGKPKLYPNFLDSVGLYTYYCLFIKPRSCATVATSYDYNYWEKLYICGK